MRQHLWPCKTSKSRVARVTVALCGPLCPKIPISFTLLQGVRLRKDVNLR